MSNVFFTSDLHFGHESIVDFRRSVHGQDFQDAEDVNIWLMDRWNARVRPKDLVWVLGDVVWGNENLKWLDTLNGTKNLILGNHDLEKGHYFLKGYMSKFKEIYGVKKKYGFVMSHVPIHPNELAYRSWKTNVHGHIHHKEKMLEEPEYINVNVDVNSGFPLTLEEIRERIKDGAEINSGGDTE